MTQVKTGAEIKYRDEIEGYKKLALNHGAEEITISDGDWESGEFEYPVVSFDLPQLHSFAKELEVIAVAEATKDKAALDNSLNAKLKWELELCKTRCVMLSNASAKLLKRYVELINSGDCGNWNPENETSVIELRAAMSANEETIEAYENELQAASGGRSQTAIE